MRILICYRDGIRTVWADGPLDIVFIQDSSDDVRPSEKERGREFMSITMDACNIHSVSTEEFDELLGGLGG